MCWFFWTEECCFPKRHALCKSILSLTPELNTCHLTFGESRFLSKEICVATKIQAWRYLPLCLSSLLDSRHSEKGMDFRRWMDCTERTKKKRKEILEMQMNLNFIHGQWKVMDAWDKRGECVLHCWVKKDCFEVTHWPDWQWDEAKHGELLEDRKYDFSMFSKKVSTLPSVSPHKY